MCQQHHNGLGERICDWYSRVQGWNLVGRCANRHSPWKGKLCPTRGLKPKKLGVDCVLSMSGGMSGNGFT
jgi:hypothetical protein